MPFLLQLIMLMHGLLTFIEHHKIRVLRFASRQRQKTAGIQTLKHPDAIFTRCACQWVMVVRLDRTRSVNVTSSSFLARTPGLYRKKCKACQDDNHFNFKECKRCGGALDIQSPGRPRETTASECQLFL